MYVFKILVGDYKKVFHEKFDVFTVKCSIDHETFNKAYKTALNKFDFRLKVCSIYTGNRISENLLLEYKNKYNIDLLPIIKSVNCIYVSESKEYILTIYDLFNVFMEFIREYGEIPFTYEITKIPIIGYDIGCGCYSN
jgi:hypothetical protein